ncbi:MAG TPA: hypothetical protein VL017_02230, partial [Devosia sp.]|nr:hypothetical protein [Devosia sp.]
MAQAANNSMNTRGNSLVLNVRNERSGSDMGLIWARRHGFEPSCAQFAKSWLRPVSHVILSYTAPLVGRGPTRLRVGGGGLTCFDYGLVHLNFKVSSNFV